MKNRKKFKNSLPASGSVDSTLILGDLTDLTQITRDGNVVTLHGRETPKSFTLPNEAVAASFWQALAEEASAAVCEDRQFFCVSFGAADSENVGQVLH